MMQVCLNSVHFFLWSKLVASEPKYEVLVICHHQENVRVIFGVFVSGNQVFEVYVFVSEVFQDLCL